MSRASRFLVLSLLSFLMIPAVADEVELQPRFPDDLRPDH
jgi:hypothetical protein